MILEKEFTISSIADHKYIYSGNAGRGGKPPPSPDNRWQREANHRPLASGIPGNGGRSSPDESKAREWW